MLLLKYSNDISGNSAFNIHFSLSLIIIIIDEGFKFVFIDTTGNEINQTLISIV